MDADCNRAHFDFLKWGGKDDFAHDPEAAKVNFQEVPFDHECVVIETVANVDSRDSKLMATHCTPLKGYFCETTCIPEGEANQTFI